MELLSSEKEVDVTKYYDGTFHNIATMHHNITDGETVLVRVVRTISLNEATFKT